MAIGTGSVVVVMLLLPDQHRVQRAPHLLGRRVQQRRGCD
jgi:hypothetical protein